MLKLTTDKHEASHGLSATAELLVVCCNITLQHYGKRLHLQCRYETFRIDEQRRKHIRHLST